MKKYIFRFEISVQNLIVVHVLDRITNLFDNGLDLGFSQDLLPSQMSVQISRETELHHQINMVFVRKEGIKLYYIGMIQVKLYLNLSRKLNDD
jgi:hypothetical protein